MMVVSRLDVRIMRFTPLKDEAVPVLRVMRLKGIIPFFIGCIKKI
jgi:hypothetical protein